MLSLFFVVIIKLDSGWELNKKKLQIISLAELSVVRRRFSHFCFSNMSFDLPPIKLFYWSLSLSAL
jgi:hypothetical protein